MKSMCCMICIFGFGCFGEAFSASNSAGSGDVDCPIKSVKTTCLHLDAGSDSELGDGGNGGSINSSSVDAASSTSETVVSSSAESNTSIGSSDSSSSVGGAGGGR